MTRTVKLWAYLPEFLKAFLELDHVLLTEEPEFQLLADNLDRLHNDLYILTATDEGLKMYEKVLSIKPGLSDSIEDRRTAVLTRWNDLENFTIEVLKKRIDAIQGNDEAIVEIDPNNPFILNITCDLNTVSQMTSVVHILDTMVPANTETKFRNQIQDSEPVQNYFGLGIVDGGFLTAQTNQTDVDNDGWLTDEEGSIITDPQYFILFDDEVIS